LRPFGSLAQKSANFGALGAIKRGILARFDAMCGLNSARARDSLTGWKATTSTLLVAKPGHSEQRPQRPPPKRHPSYI
jgi:hypothetical protein